MRTALVLLCTCMSITAGELQQRMPTQDEQYFMKAVGAKTFHNIEAALPIESLLWKNGALDDTPQIELKQAALCHLKARLCVTTFDEYYQRCGGDDIIAQFQEPWWKLWPHHPDKSRIENCAECIFDTHYDEVKRRRNMQQQEDTRNPLFPCTPNHTIHQPEYQDWLAQELHEQLFRIP